MRFFHLGIIAVCLATAIIACGRASAPSPSSDEGKIDTTAVINYLRGVDLEGRGDPALFVELGALYRSRGTIIDRLYSQQVLERGLRRFPDNPQILLELGRTYYAQTFYPDAIRCFNEALDIDPGLCDARYHLGMTFYDRWRRVNEYTDDLATARWHLKATVACDPTNRDAAVRYASALYVLGADTLATVECTELLKRFPDCADGYLLRGVIAFEADQFADAHADFQRGLELLDEEARRVYDEMERVLSYTDHGNYDAAPASTHDAFQRGFWLDVDPDPTTPTNERWLEHVVRVFLSDLYFSCVRPPLRGWDTDRGKTFIKFGRPQSTTYSLQGRSSDGHTETWTYVINGNFHAFLFVDEFLNGNLRVPRYDDLKWSFIGHSTRATAYLPSFRTVAGVPDVVAFRDSEFASTFYMVVGVNADSLVGDVTGQAASHIYLRGAFFDDTWTQEHRFADTLTTADLAFAKRADVRIVEILRASRLPFDRYHIAIALESASGGVACILRTEGDARRYALTGLSLSDILMQRAPATPGVMFQRGDHTLYPNTGRHYPQGDAIRPYVEIYNLDVAAGQSDYLLTFSIYEAEKEEPAWRRWVGRLVELAGAGTDRVPAISQTFDRSGAEHTETETLIINIETLPTGDYELAIDVADNISGNAAQTSVTFTIGR